MKSEDRGANCDGVPCSLNVSCKKTIISKPVIITTALIHCSDTLRVYGFGPQQHVTPSNVITPYGCPLRQAAFVLGKCSVPPLLTWICVSVGTPHTVYAGITTLLLISRIG